MASCLDATTLAYTHNQKIPTHQGCTFTMKRQERVQGGEERDFRHKYMHTHTHTTTRAHARTHTHAHRNSNRGFANDFVGHQRPHTKHPAGNYHVVFVACACAPDLNESCQRGKVRLNCWHLCEQETLLSQTCAVRLLLGSDLAQPIAHVCLSLTPQGCETMTSPN